jgi:alkylation response protein AidB-like acyl-CoA dehydrogenase
MNFELTEEQALYRDTVRGFLSDRSCLRNRAHALKESRGYDLANWAELAKLGVLALPFPTDLGGLGGTAQEVGIVQEEIGYHLAVEPFAQNIVLPATALTYFADRDLATALAEDMISGKRTIAIAVGEDRKGHATGLLPCRGRLSGDGIILSGGKPFVTYPSAELLLVSVALEHSAEQVRSVLVLVPAETPGVTINHYRLIDGTPAADIELENVELPVSAVVIIDRAGDAIDGMYQMGAHATAAESLGILRRMVKLTTEYTKNRIQFGKPLAANQVVRHRLAEMLMQYELAQSVVAGLNLYRVGTMEATRQLSAAKVTIADAFEFIGKQSIQLHGAIGLTEEYELSHLYKRALVLQDSYGSKRSHSLKLGLSEAT